MVRTKTCRNSTKSNIKGLWTPSEFQLDIKLTAIDKDILSAVNNLCKNEDKTCTATNLYIANVCGCSERKVSQAISQFIEDGRIIFVRFNGRTRFLRTPTGIPNKKAEQRGVSPLPSLTEEKTKKSTTSNNILSQTNANCQVNKPIQPNKNIKSHRSSRENGTNPRAKRTNPRYVENLLKTPGKPVENLRVSSMLPSRFCYPARKGLLCDIRINKKYINNIKPLTPFRQKGTCGDDKTWLKSSTHTEQVSAPQGIVANKTNINSRVSVRDLLSEFSRLWDVYPKHEDVNKALKIFLSLGLTADDVEYIIARIKLFTATGAWNGIEIKFVPNLGRFLYERLWGDDKYLRPRADKKKPYMRNEFTSFKIEDLDRVNGFNSEPEHYNSFRVEDL